MIEPTIWVPMAIISTLTRRVRRAIGWRFFSWFVLLGTENPLGSIFTDPKSVPSSLQIPKYL